MWDIIAHAALVSDTLKAERGAIAGRFQTEDEWFRGIHAHLEKNIKDPDGYADYWDLENAEGVTADMIGNCTTALCRRVDEILAIPLNKRATSSLPS